MTKFANFKISVEIEKLKIYVEGDREIAPEIASNVATQISAMMKPAALIDAPKNGNGHKEIASAEVITASRKRRKSSSRGGQGSQDSSDEINWAHDPAKWGSPVQTWKQSQKIAWLLLVAEQVAGKSGLSTGEMTDIFNRKFREAGLLIKGNIPRDLKAQSDNFGVADGAWFLKQGGKEIAQKLVAEAKGEK